MESKKTKFLLMLVCSLSLTVEAQQKADVLHIVEQGSFMIGGSHKVEPGTFSVDNALDPQGQSFHGDHAYTFYQIPENARALPLVFLHGAGQSKKTWETTADGRDGFQNIFLRRNYPVYLLDQPRRGEAGRSTAETIVKPVADEQFWFTQFRLGNFPDYFPGVQFPKDKQSLEQFFRQMTPNTGAFDTRIVSEAVSALFDKIGKAILITHSQGGGPGWMTAIQNPKVSAIVAYEPYSGFVFPKGELPLPISSTGLFGPLSAVEIPLSDFKKLTQIPIVIYYGDNIAKEASSVWNKDHWRSGLEMARLWATTINKHGGDAKVIHLSDVGIQGNTHFPFSDLNNIQVADELSRWLAEKGLDKSQVGVPSHLNAQQKAIVGIASQTAKGDLPKLKIELHTGLESGLTINQIKEVLVHCYAYAGFPRSIRGLQTFMTVLDERRIQGINDNIGAEASPIDEAPGKYDRGKAILDTLLGTPQKGPQTGYAAFAPIIEVFLKEHLFADIFERDVLTYAERELVTIAVLSSIGGVDPMLQSHLNICLNVGLSVDQLQQFVTIINSSVGEKESKAAQEVLAEVLKNRK